MVRDDGVTGAGVENAVPDNAVSCIQRCYIDGVNETPSRNRAVLMFLLARSLSALPVVAPGVADDALEEHHPLRIKEFKRNIRNKSPMQLEATGLLAIGDMVVAINGKSVRGRLVGCAA